MPVALVKCLHTEGAGHDCAYVEIRNFIIDSAAAHADKMIGTRPDRHKAWNALYAAEMEQRWRKSMARRALRE